MRSPSSPASPRRTRSRTDADVRVDTTGRSIEDALDDVIAGLRDAGYLDLSDPRWSRWPSQATHAHPAAEPRPLNVLFVCTANICRSPFMEITARELAGPDAPVEFSSAGTHGFREYPMDSVMAGALTERGLSADTFLSRPLTADLIEDADLVLTAEASHRAFILDDHAAAFRKVFTLGQVAEVVRNSPEGLTGPELLRALGERRGASEPRLDVRDPYGRGAKAAERPPNRSTSCCASSSPPWRGPRGSRHERRLRRRLRRRSSPPPSSSASSSG